MTAIVRRALAFGRSVGAGLALLLTFGTPARADDASTAPKPPSPPPPPCSEPEYRQFDFWVGDWEVRTPNDKVAGTNRIDKILGGCVLQENWVGARGMTGHSFNIYDPGDRKWHQTWVDSQGTLLLLSGELTDGKMVLSGATAANGATKAALHRITWTPLPDGTVRQLWESSGDDGKTWTIAFDGSYRRKK